MIESRDSEDFLFEGWDPEDDDPQPSSPPAWRRSLLIAVALVTAIAIAIVPIYNVFFARTVAENGLEVCGFDYCIVQEAVRDAGLDLTMSRLANTFLDENQARSLANDLTRHLGIEPVGLQVVEVLDGRLGGVYDPVARSISIESPARAWTVLHEVAHSVESGHGDDFHDVLIDLATYMEP